MTDYKDFDKHIIVAVHNVLPHKNTIKAVITTSHFDRLTTKPYEIAVLDWQEIILRGWIE